MRIGKLLARSIPGWFKKCSSTDRKPVDKRNAESDVDVILIVKNEAGARKRELRRIGYLLAAKTEVLPSILAYTEEEWESRKRSGSSFRKAVERDAMRIV
jgi:hypothetical protein